MLEIVIQEGLWSIRESYSAILNLPLMNVKCHSDPQSATVNSIPFRLFTTFMIMIPSLTFTDLRVVPWNICNGYGIRAANAYPSGHLFSSHLGLAHAQIAISVFPNLPYLFSSFDLEYPSVLSRFCFKSKDYL